MLPLIIRVLLVVVLTGLGGSLRAHEVKPLAAEQLEEYKLDPAFYKKGTWVEDILIATSEKVSDAAHLEAAYQAAEVGALEPLKTGPGWAHQVAVSALEAQGILAREAGRVSDSVGFFEGALEIAGDDNVMAAQALLGLASS